MTYNIPTVNEREVFEQRLPVELNPGEVSVWCEMKPFDLTSCDRFLIYLDRIKGDPQPRYYIEFHFGRKTLTYWLDNEDFSISNLCIPPSNN